MSTKLIFPVRFSVLIILLLACAAGVLAQSQATTGNIEGRVLDPKQAAVPGATVTATNQQTGLEKSTTTNDEGSFLIILLPPGTYTVRAGAGGFAQSEIKDLTVNVGSKTPLDITLSVGAASGTVTVSSEAPTIETTLTSVSTTINSRAIENLPVNGRNYLDFATLTPGVIRDQNREGDLSVGGQKGTLNNLQVDGADNNNTFFGQSFGRTGVRPPYQFSEESVQEFQVNQNGFSAEFGRAGGAVINVVTKSGTNDFHGGAFEYFRDESLNANTPQLKASQFQRGLPNKRPPLQINQFGGRLGGPIKRNKAFFFFTYDGQRQKLPNFLDPPNFFAQPANIQALLLPKLNTYQVNRDQDVLMVKGDISLTGNNQLSLRFNQQNFTGKNNEFTGTLGTEEHSGDSIAKTTTFSGALISTITASTTNEFRFQVAKDREPGEANSDQPEAQINTGSGFLLIGRNNFSPRETTIKRLQFIDNLSHLIGRHNFKAGIDVNRDRIFNFFPGFFSGQYTFTYASFGTNTPSAFSQNFAGAGTSGATTHPNSTDFAVFLQDDFRVNSKLTLNLGLRYDKQFMARPPVRNPDPALLAAGLDTSRQPNDSNNFGPRAGFSYAPNEKMVIRGGYGLFFGRTTAIMLGTAHSNNGINILGVTLNCTAVPNPCPTYPNIFTTAPAAGANIPNLFLFSKDYQQPYVQQGRIGVEREIMKDTTLSVTYLYFRGVHLSRTRDINLFPPVATTAIDPGTGQTFTVQRFPGTGATPADQFTSASPLRPNPRFNRINLFENSANSRYQGLAIQGRKRFSQTRWVPFFQGGGSQLLLSYTFSKAEDDKPDQTSVVPGGGDDSKVAENPFDLRNEWSYSDADQRHRLVLSSVFELGKIKSTNKLLRAIFNDYTLSGIMQLQSGFAYSAQVGADLNRDGNSRDDRVPGFARNSFRTPTVYQSDARITRTIRTSETTKLRLILEGFNIWNRANTGLAPGGGYFSFVNVNQFRGFMADAATSRLTLLPALPANAFGLPRSIITPRQLQLAIKFDF
ncbi:MAG TPA: carboxypeptidase regulatory-like domain-containing protein [Pyrinomonadaceae bacterium]|jgi:outer membrane receptor protein involved in Fe transport